LPIAAANELGQTRKEACLLSEHDAEKVSGKAAEKEANLFPQIVGFLRNVKKEMKLVSRPSWKEVRSTTVVVIIFVFLFAFYLRGLDWIFSPLDRWLFSH
jgi:preprotein translocase SecE subunit